jgi:hypothetical protein
MTEEIAIYDEDALRKSKRALKLPQLSTGDLARFYFRVDKSPGQGPKGGCWAWRGTRTGSSTGYNYGLLFYLDSEAGSRKKPRYLRANRIAYFLANGRDPFPYIILHSCDWPPCVNPDHLSTGTYADNQRDASNKGRMASGARNGMAKITLDEAREIVRLRNEGHLSIPELVLKFGISRAQISRIANGHRWSYINSNVPVAPIITQRGDRHPNRTLSSAIVLRERLAYANRPERLGRISERLGVTKSTVSCFLRGDTWKDAGGPLVPKGSSFSVPKPSTV